MLTPHQQPQGNEVTVGRGYEADDAHTATNASTTTIRQRQEPTEDALQGNLRDMTKEDSADPSSLQHGRRVQTATAHRLHAGAAPHALVTLGDPHPMAEAPMVAHRLGADHLRQGGNQDVMTGPHQINSEDAGVKMPTAVPAGHILATNPRGDVTLTRTQLHWEASKQLRIQASLVQHQTATRARSRAGTIVMAFAKMETRAVSTTPPHADTC